MSVFAGITGANISVRINNFRYVIGHVYDIYDVFLEQSNFFANLDGQFATCICKLVVMPSKAQKHHTNNRLGSTDHHLDLSVIRVREFITTSYSKTKFLEIAFLERGQPFLPN